MRACLGSVEVIPDAMHMTVLLDNFVNASWKHVTPCLHAHSQYVRERLVFNSLFRLALVVLLLRVRLQGIRV